MSKSEPKSLLPLHVLRSLPKQRLRAPPPPMTPTLPLTAVETPVANPLPTALPLLMSRVLQPVVELIPLLAPQPMVPMVKPLPPEKDARWASASTHFTRQT